MRKKEILFTLHVFKSLYVHNYYVHVCTMRKKCHVHVFNVTCNVHTCRLDDITYGSFVAHIGYKHVVSASDMVMCVTALLEGGEVRNNVLG